jgi:hypothetical protein
MSLSLIFLAQTMVQTLDERPQPGVGATEFNCSFVALESGTEKYVNFDMFGTLPEFPEQHSRSLSLPVQIGSSDSKVLKGNALADAPRASEWFREYQVVRYHEGETYVVTLKLRKEGTSIATATQYNSAWGEEPYRYYASGLCKAKFAQLKGAGE